MIMNLKYKVLNYLFNTVWNDFWNPIKNFGDDKVRYAVSDFIRKSVQNPTRDSINPVRDIIDHKLNDYEFER